MSHKYVKEEFVVKKKCLTHVLKKAVSVIILLQNMLLFSDKRRVPAWCDRILWQVHDDAFEKITIAAELLEYKSLPFYVLSDHKPVVARFKLKVRF